MLRAYSRLGVRGSALAAVLRGHMGYGGIEQGPLKYIQDKCPIHCAIHRSGPDSYIFLNGKIPLGTGVEGRQDQPSYRDQHQISAGGERMNVGKDRSVRDSGDPEPAWKEGLSV